MREHVIEQFLIKECKARGWLCLKFLSPSMAGLPDRMILAPGGRVVFVELKAPGQKPRRLQESVHNMLRQLGFSVCVLDSKEAVRAYMKQLGGDENAVHTP